MMIKGSKGRIGELVSSPYFLEKMNFLLQGTGALITEYDNWMPKSIFLNQEVEPKDFLRHNFTVPLGNDIKNWWVNHGGTTPTLDLISTCTIHKRKGIILVEAKAHEEELNFERKGKDKPDSSNPRSVDNDVSIKQAIENANKALSIHHSKIKISKDTCYQLSNRVAHTWWLANEGIPVVLMYLGFLNVINMEDGKNKIFHKHEEWEKCFTEHSKFVGVDSIIDKQVNCGKAGFKLICRSL